jgi:hypothetical protein
MLRKLPPLNALKALEAAARNQSFTIAVSELGVTHGAVSRQVQSLELGWVPSFSGASTGGSSLQKPVSAIWPRPARCSTGSGK